MAPGYCSIEWKQDAADPFSFTVSDDTGGNIAGKYSTQSFASKDHPQNKCIALLKSAVPIYYIMCHFMKPNLLSLSFKIVLLNLALDRYCHILNVGIGMNLIEDCFCDPLI